MASPPNHTRMDLELLNYINGDLKWNCVKKGRRSIRKRQDKTAFETNKIVDAPLKKRKVLQQSPLPAGPQTPSVHYKDPSQLYHTHSISKCQKTKSKSRLRNKSLSKKADFSGIQLLADVACSSLIYDDEKMLKKLDIKEGIISTKSDGSLNRDTLVPDSQNLQEDGNEKAALCSKGLRLHWDLNTVMDDWEEKPCNDENTVTAVPLIEGCNGDSLRKTCEVVEEDLGTKTVSSKTSDCESCVSKSDVVDFPVKSEDSTTSDLQEEIIVMIEPVSKSDEQCDKKVMSEDPTPSECCGSNVTQDDKIQTGSGYDSPFEDGELREEISKSDNNTYKHDSGTIENSLLEVKDDGQTIEDETSLAMPNTTTVVEEDKSGIQHSQHNVEESDCGSGKESSGRKNDPMSDDLCRNVPYVPQTRSSNIGNSYPHSSSRRWDLKSSHEHYRLRNNNRNYYSPRVGDYRRPSPSERNNSYEYGDNYRPPNRYRYHSQDYLERKARCYSPKRSRSRSGSPIAWNFQKRKNSDVTQSVDHLSLKSFDDRKFTDGTEFRRHVGYPERIKSDDYVRFGQQSGRFSTHKYKENGYTRK